MKILIIEDDDNLRELMHKALADEHHIVETAASAKTALMKVEIYDYDCILLDIMLPDGSGLDVLRQLKASRKQAGVIIVSAKDSLDDKILGLDLGADDYLTKPFNVEVLRLRVKKIIEWAQNNHQQFRQKINIEPSEITITPLDEEFIKRAIDLVEKNIGDSDFSVETLASAVAMSRSTLYKKLMAITGLGPSEFIRTIRIKRGKALLETSQMQITEIAYAVGFTTVKSFTMNFKAEYGMTPSEFRNRT